MMLVAEATASEVEQGLVLPERRRGLRIRQSRPIKVFEPTLERYFGGQTEDISSTGLRLELPLSTPILPGKRLEIHVGQNSSGELLAIRRQMIMARVIWIDRATTGARGRLVAGVQFLSSMAAQVDAA
ncbi:MAG: PilZ domain-containing protein [Planctomycetota bacterium]|nr:PilZ domain-containing protein [Planctomycetota bacterium]